MSRNSSGLTPRISNYEERIKIYRSRNSSGLTPSKIRQYAGKWIYRSRNSSGLTPSNDIRTAVKRSYMSRNSSGLTPDVIALFGRHGFEWSVIITRASNKCLMKVTSFPEGRAKAVAYYKQMCKEIQ